jgi:hypothetical protein
MARDLTKLEYENYEILCQQLEDDRPHRVMCNLADQFIMLFRAYEKLKKQQGGGE